MLTMLSTHHAQAGTDKATHSNFAFISHGSCSNQNRREYQEDRYLVHDLRALPDFKTYQRAALYGVFDGHGGDIVSEYLSKQFAKHFLAQPGLQQLLQQSPERALINAL